MLNKIWFHYVFCPKMEEMHRWRPAHSDPDRLHVAMSKHKRVKNVKNLIPSIRKVYKESSSSSVLSHISKYDLSLKEKHITADIKSHQPWSSHKWPHENIKATRLLLLSRGRGMLVWFLIQSQSITAWPKSNRDKQGSGRGSLISFSSIYPNKSHKSWH